MVKPMVRLTLHATHREHATRGPQYASVAIAVILACTPYAVLAWWMGRTGRAHSLAGFLEAVTVTWILLAAATQNWRRFFLWQFPLFLLGIAFAAYTVAFRNPPGNLLATIIATSTPGEFAGFFSVWSGQRLLLAGLFLSGVYLCAAWRVPAVRISSRRATLLRTGVLGLTGALGLAAAIHADTLIDGLVLDPLIGSAVFVAGPLHEARLALGGKDIVKVPYGATRHGAEEVHILVIGESGRRNSWSVYGYGRPTTPYLDSIKNELILFADAVADANLTAYAVPMLLTGMSPETYDIAAVRGNIVDLAKEAGYSTSWMTNQDLGVSALVGMAAQRTVHANMLTPYFGGAPTLDGSMLPPFEAETRRKGASRFVSLHAMGSHWEYYRRYPPQFQRFGSAKGLKFISAFTGRPDQSVVDAYDNSVLYTDWFLHQVIESARMLKVPATVTYMADHGEDLYSLDGASGHGYPTFTPHQFAVPAFVWANSAYREAHPDKIAALQANAGKEIRTHDVFFSLADLMGISWPGAKRHGSFASSDFVPDTAGKVLAGGKLVDPRVEVD
jgi:glucan phosphoethanolaminetransferase (alkaline phosphatase superfamily)